MADHQRAGGSYGMEVVARMLTCGLPFGIILAGSTTVAVRWLFPRLSAAGQEETRDGEDHVLPQTAPAALRQAHAEHGAKSGHRRSRAWAFGATVGLSATLGSLIMAEISDTVDVGARNAALAVTVPGLLVMLVVVIPWLECRSLVSSAGWSFQRSAQGRPAKVAPALQTLLFLGWLFVFWRMGDVVPRAEVLMRSTPDRGPERRTETLIRECLERVGVVGISLMALLSGFASVSAPWHTFGGTDPLMIIRGRRGRRGRRAVTEADVNRKQTGLDATGEMLATKRHKLQQLERRARDDAGGAATKGVGLVGMVMSSIRGSTGEEVEMRGLAVEIAGLEAMEASLASRLSLMKSQRAASARAATARGRVLAVPSYVFGAYCVYRVVATGVMTMGRLSSARGSLSTSDPVSGILGLLARHWDPSLDRLAWARIISFALSGVILAASANSAVQTFHLFAKWTPGLLRHAQANLALAVGQVLATYVISASLLLRSQLPSEARMAVGGVLRGALTPAFVDGWFEGWFLLGSVVTLLGLWLGRKMGGDEWDEFELEEMGAKRC